MSAYGKDSARRPGDLKKYAQGWRRIWGKRGGGKIKYTARVKSEICIVNPRGIIKVDL